MQVSKRAEEKANGFDQEATQSGMIPLFALSIFFAFILHEIPVKLCSFIFVLMCLGYVNMICVDHLILLVIW